MKKKLLMCVATIMTMTTLLVGCQKTEEKKTEETNTVQEEVKVSYPVTVTDQLGREVTIEKEPETLVSGYYISTSMLIALDEEDNLVGIEAKADKRNIYKLSAPELIELPSVGTAKEFDLEGCAALKPDLVILPAKLKSVIPSLEELGITVLAVNPENQELLEDALMLLGTATNSKERAEGILKYTDEKLDELESALKDTEKPNVYLAGNSAFLSTAGASMYQNNLIENAGGKNVAEELQDTYWADVSYEQVIAWQPDYVIMASDANYTQDSILTDENLANCNFVSDKHVYQFPNTIEAWDSPLPGSVLGNLWLASVLHPEEYTEKQYKDAVIEFYETYYDFTPEI